MAFLRHRSELQPILPQILVGNKRRFTLPLLRSVSGSAPGNVHLFRKQSSWVNAEVVKEALALVASALKEVQGIQVVIVMGTAIAAYLSRRYSCCR